MGKLDVQYSRLQSVHPAVDALHYVFSLSTMSGEGRCPIGQGVVIRYDATGVAISSQIFSRIK